MGSPDLCCVQCPSDYIVAEPNVTGSLYHTQRNSVEEFDYDGQVPCISTQKTVPIGSNFQAELPNLVIPNLKGIKDSNDEACKLRWIDKRIWPQEQKENAINTFDQEPQYHHVLCSCNIQGTLECVRLHIEEKKALLKGELGDAFVLWGFNEMGEIVAEHWTHDEELAFHDVIRRSPLSFWQKLLDVFPSKCMADLVSYYFNVFVLQRRAIQNRLTPENIDSDDDEMILDNSDKDSDNNLLISDEEDNESEAESLVDDAIHEDKEENGFSAWSAKDDNSCRKILDNYNTLLMVETSGQVKTYVEPSLKVDAIHEQSKEDIKVSSCSSGGSGSSHMIKSWEMLSWEHTRNFAVSEGCAKEVWNSPSLLLNQDDVDKLISTNGLMEEFFGAETRKNRK